MLKYIIKRLLISIVILLGVSIIIYTMVRLMPNDYVDNKFKTQLATGTIDMEDILQFKKLYGIGDNSVFCRGISNGSGIF